MSNLLKDLSLILFPAPSLEHLPEDVHSDVQWENHHEREAYQEQLELMLDADEHGFDPLLREIQLARKAMVSAEQQMRVLIAYGREFVTPRGYRLEELAMAAGMSISGVRTAYGEEEIAEVQQALGVPPRSARSAGGAG